jgi:hypothetical protein
MPHRHSCSSRSQTHEGQALPQRPVIPCYTWGIWLLKSTKFAVLTLEARRSGTNSQITRQVKLWMVQGIVYDAVNDTANLYARKTTK